MFKIIIGSAVLGLLYALITSKQVFSAATGNADMQRIAAAIQEGAKAYLNRQYSTIAMVGIVIAIILAWTLSPLVSVGFCTGAILSGLAGYIGMYVSVRANVRTAEAARVGIRYALDIAFKSGAITGMLVVSLGLIGVSAYYYYLISTGLPTRQIIE
ncbi:MAG: sodium/proton-translocating pyrophosphatase, partial [Alphaproteobacteria bacterium]|nr:sodium/proton-translocating pyrophosphatase [Alphaproteobacteria bacterium]